MIKASLLVMVVLTVVIATLLRWREQRLPAAAQPKRLGLVALGKRKVDRWVTAAALAALFTLLVIGGLNWLRIWTGG